MKIKNNNNGSYDKRYKEVINNTINSANNLNSFNEYLNKVNC